MFLPFDQVLSTDTEAVSEHARTQEPAEWSNDHLCGVQLIPNWLNLGELDALRDLEGVATWRPGLLINAAANERESECAWLQPGKSTAWLYRKIVRTFIDANTRYHFDLRGMNEAPQLIRYAADGRIGWHHDLGCCGASVRKLALIALVRRSSDCIGGLLEISGCGPIDQMDQHGCATVFPPFVSHRVTPLNRGSRVSLVAWACGPSYR